MLIIRRFALFFVFLFFLLGGGLGLILGYQLGAAGGHLQGADKGQPEQGGVNLQELGVSRSGISGINGPDGTALNSPKVAEVNGAPRLTGWQSLIDQGNWYLLQQHMALPGYLPPEDVQAFLAQLKQRVNKYDALPMRRVLRAYAQQFPEDVEALFMISDLQQIEGASEAALETLLNIMNGGFLAEEISRAKKGADQIIGAITAGLKNRGSVAELEAFWRHISQQYPTSDYYRYEWARALAELQRWEEAQRVLAETGTSDISQQTLDQFALTLARAQSGWGFAKADGQLLASVRGSSGSEVTLLVDTGANITSLSKQALRRLGAQPLGDKVRVRTAGGVIETSTYRIAYMEVQGQVVTDLRVLQLEADLPGMDGLLGTDVLQRFDWPVDNL